MTETLLLIIVIITAVLLVVNITLTVRAGRRESAPAALDEIRLNVLAFDRNLKDELSRGREEAAKSAREAREELSGSMKALNDSLMRTVAELSQMQKAQLDTFSSQLAHLSKSNADQIERMTLRQGELTKTMEEKLELMRGTVEGKLKAIQDDTNQKLEKMRETVDEKLHKTLEQRLGESFKMVSERLEQVHKGLGEMQSLAVGVGDLKKVLTNVKTRGIHGEIQLGNILEQILTPDQYACNVATRKGSRENVEFAVKLPGKDGDGGTVHLPIDSKFPLETYYALQEAYDRGDHAAVEEAGKFLEANIKKCAKDIRDKYIDPPGTTDFGIMFLPIEGLYAEVVRRTGLFEILQREYRISITGPTTLAAFLNSLQMGFRTLAIEKQSSEVWRVLGTVKNEFEKFGDILQKTQVKLTQASEDLDKLVGVRTRQIQKTLKGVQQMPGADLFGPGQGGLLEDNSNE